MPATIRCHLELRLRLRAPNLTRGPLVARLVLSLLGRPEHLARSGHGGFVLGDPGADLPCTACQCIQTRDRQGFALTEPLDEGACFRGLAGGPLVLSPQCRGVVSCFDICSRGLRSGFLCDNRRTLRRSERSPPGFRGGRGIVASSRAVRYRMPQLDDFGAPPQRTRSRLRRRQPDRAPGIHECGAALHWGYTSQE